MLSDGDFRSDDKMSESDSDEQMDKIINQCVCSCHHSYKVDLKCTQCPCAKLLNLRDDSAPIEIDF